MYFKCIYWCSEFIVLWLNSLCPVAEHRICSASLLNVKCVSRKLKWKGYVLMSIGTLFAFHPALFFCVYETNPALISNIISAFFFQTTVHCNQLWQLTLYSHCNRLETTWSCPLLHTFTSNKICSWFGNSHNELICLLHDNKSKWAPVVEHIFVLKSGASYHTGRSPFLPRWMRDMSTKIQGIHTSKGSFSGIVLCAASTHSQTSLWTNLNRDFKVWLGWGYILMQ